MRRRPGPAPRRADERGAVAVLTAILMTIVLGFAAFAVDLGTQRVAARDVQALADVVALDAARLLDGRTAQQVRAGDGTHPSLVDATDRSRARNAATVLGRDVRVTPYLVALDAQGRWNLDAAGNPVQVAAATVPRAVVVVARSTVDFGFARVLGVSSGTPRRASAANAATPSVCFSIGTKALTLDTTGSVLSPVLDRILRVNLSAVGYEGLVSTKNASVPVAGLLAQLNIASTDALAASNVTLSSVLLASAAVAERGGDTATATALRAVRLGVPGSAFSLARILSLQSGTDVAGLSSTIDVLGLVGAAVVAANGQNAIGLTVPGLAELKVVEPPRIACGVRGATASSAQVTLRLNPTLVATAGLGLLGGGTDLTVRVGSGTATIAADLTCAPETVTLDVRTGVATIDPPVSPAYGQVRLDVTLARFLSFLGPLNVLTNAALGLLGINQVALDVLLTGGVATSAETRTVTYPAAPGMPPVLQVPQSGTGSVLTLNATGVRLTPGQNASLLGLLTPLLNGALSAVLNGLVAPVVSGVVNPALTAVLNPVLGALGIKLGVADVTLLSRPVCRGTKLVG